MADFQHVVPVHAAQVRKRKCSDSQNDCEYLGSGTFHSETLYFVDYKLIVMPPCLINFFLSGWQIRQDIRKQMMEMS
jgi:hypothetical protein